MEEEKNVGEVKVKNKYTLPLVIIGIVLVALIVLGVLKFLNNKSPKNVYISTIDGFAESFNKTIDVNEKLFDSSVSSDIEVKFDANATRSEFRAIANLLNKISLKGNAEVDKDKKSANVKMNLLYNGSNAINSNMHIRNNDIFVEIPDLYEKNIKVPDVEIGELWNTLNKEDLKTVINEFSSILKNNLKEEYFTKEETDAEIDGKKVKVSKQIMNLKENDVKVFEESIINDIQKNEKLLNSLANISGQSKEDIKSQIEDEKNNLNSEYSSIKSEMHINKSNGELLYFTIISDSENLALTRTSENNYDILHNEEKIGNAVFKDDEFEISAKYDGTNINYRVVTIGKNAEITVKAEMDGILIEMLSTGDSSESSGYVRVKSSLYGIDVKVSFKTKYNSVSSVNSDSITNYVDADKIGEEELGKIMEKIQNNSVMSKMIQDISSLFNNIQGAY